MTEFKIVKFKNKSFKVFIRKEVFKFFRRFLKLKPKYKYKPLRVNIYSHFVNSKFRFHFYNGSYTYEGAIDLLKVYKNFRKHSNYIYRGFTFKPLIYGNNDGDYTIRYYSESFCNSHRYELFNNKKSIRDKIDDKLDSNHITYESFID